MVFQIKLQVNEDLSMALSCLFLLLITWIMTITSIDGRVETNNVTWYQQCCTNCPPVEVLVGTEVYNQSRYAMICQMGREGNEPYYATLFDKQNKIPVFSKFVVQSGSSPRKSKFLLEGDLVYPMDGYVHTENEINSFLHANNITNITIESTQATDGDYFNQSTSPTYQKGHLNPHASFRFSRDAVNSTHTYTNVAPQVSNFNLGTWKVVENTVRLYANGCPNHTAVVGVTPSRDSPLNGRVNIPSFFWTYLLCNRTISAILAPNTDNKNFNSSRLVTQLYLNESDLNHLLITLNSLSHSSIQHFENGTRHFRQEMHNYALPIPVGDIFSERLVCEPYVGNVNHCVGKKSKSVMNNPLYLLYTPFL